MKYMIAVNTDITKCISFVIAQHWLFNDACETLTNYNALCSVNNM